MSDIFCTTTVRITVEAQIPTIMKINDDMEIFLALIKLAVVKDSE